MPNTNRTPQLNTGSRAAREAELQRLVAATYASDPLARMTILVPNGATGDRVLELLLGGGRSFIGLEVQPLEAFARGLCERGEVVAGADVPPGGERLLVRGLLGEAGAPEAFARLGGRPGFLQAVASGLRDLLDAGLGALGRTSGLAQLHDLHLARRAELGIEDDSARFERAARLAPSHVGGTLVLFGLYDPTGLQERLVLAALAAAERAIVLLPGHTFGGPFRERLARAASCGFESLDEPPAATTALGQLRAGERGPLPDDGSLEALSLPAGLVGARLLARHLRDRLSGAELAAEDVLCVHRGSADVAAKDGIPPRALARELGHLGVPVADAGASLGGTPAGALVLALGRLLATERVSRTRLLDTLSLACAGGRLSTGRLARFERLTRDAGLRLMIGDRPRGSLSSASRLAMDRLRYQAGRWSERHAAEPSDDAAAMVAAAGELVAMVEALARLHAGLRADKSMGWGQLARRLGELLDTLGLVSAEELESWREHLSRLSGFDVLDAAPELDPAALVWFLEGVAQRPAPGAGAGAGVRIEALGRNRGGRARWVLLLDGNEGSFPRRVPSDPLLSEDERDGLGLAQDHEAEERALFTELLDLAGGAVSLVTTSAGIEAPKGATPSRFLLDVVGRATGEGPPSLEDLADGKAARVTYLGLEGVWEGDPAAGRNAEEGLLFAATRGLGTGLDQRALLAGARPPAAARVELEVARGESPGETRFDGYLAGTAAFAAAGAGAGFRGGDPSTGAKPTSASALENYASCGMRYFLGRALGVAEHEAPESGRGIDVRERGKTVHLILEAFGQASQADGLLPWRAEDHARLRELLGTSVASVVARARAKAPEELRPLWDAEEVRFRGLLRRWLAQQIAEAPSDLGTWTPTEFEWRFDGVPYELPGGGAPLWLRGAADRVDLAESEGGTRSVRVVDYKTGKGNDTSDDSTGGGQKLQLHLYGAVARRVFGAPTSTGLYDFVLGAKRTTWTGGPVVRGRPPTVEEGDAAAAREVEALVAGMEAGHFEPLPRKERKSKNTACDYCPVAEACGPWRDASRAARGDDDPVLAGLLAAVALPEEESA